MTFRHRTSCARQRKQRNNPSASSFFTVTTDKTYPCHSDYKTNKNCAFSFSYVFKNSGKNNNTNIRRLMPYFQAGNIFYNVNGQIICPNKQIRLFFEKCDNTFSGKRFSKKLVELIIVPCLCHTDIWDI